MTWLSPSAGGATALEGSVNSKSPDSGTPATPGPGSAAGTGSERLRSVPRPVLPVLTRAAACRHPLGRRYQRCAHLRHTGGALGQNHAAGRAAVATRCPRCGRGRQHGGDSGTRNTSVRRLAAPSPEPAPPPPRSPRPAPPFACAGRHRTCRPRVGRPARAGLHGPRAPPLAQVRARTAAATRQSPLLSMTQGQEGAPQTTTTPATPPHHHINHPLL